MSLPINGSFYGRSRISLETRSGMPMVRSRLELTRRKAAKSVSQFTTTVWYSPRHARQSHASVLPAGSGSRSRDGGLWWSWLGIVRRITGNGTAGRSSLIHPPWVVRALSHQRGQGPSSSLGSSFATFLYASPIVRPDGRWYRCNLRSRVHESRSNQGAESMNKILRKCPPS